MNFLSGKRLLPGLVALTLIAASCSANVSSDAGSEGSTAPTVVDINGDEIVLTSGLSTFGSCDALLSTVKKEAVEHVGPYGFDNGQFYFDGVFSDSGDEEAMEDDAATASFESEDSAGGFSGTNNQETQVDEADWVKTDGERLVVLTNSRLEVIDVSDGQAEHVDTIKLPDGIYGGQLFLEGDRALVMATIYREEFAEFDSSAADDAILPANGPSGVLVSIDLETGEVERTLELEGRYVSAREVDGTIRIVVSAPADRFAFVFPNNQGAEEVAETANKSLIESSTINQWIPTFRLTAGGDRSEVIDQGTLVDCENVHFPSEFAGFGSLVMLTADIEDGLSINDAVSVFTEGDTVYASTDRVAVATQRWPVWNEDGEIEQDDAFTTAIHTFDITDSSKAAYQATGEVRGHLLNQFSMSEWNGDLRVATTDGDPWGEFGGGEPDSESFVTVLRENGSVLESVGQVGGLGRGEQIFAVRFLGDKGYVVTFRQIDPLYTVDLSDPENPRVAGELKIPGFSSYLHPVGSDQLIGVGTDGDEEGNTTGAVVSLFDVGDPANPTRTDKLPLSVPVDTDAGFMGGSDTPVAHDAKAFTYWDDNALIPINWYAYSEREQAEMNGSEVVAVVVGADGTVTERGRVTHPSITECENGSEYSEEEAPSTDAEYCYTYTPQIQRSVIVGDNLFTISEQGVAVDSFSTLERQDFIRFERRR